MNPTPKTEFRAVLYIQNKGGSEEAIKLRRDGTIFGREKGDIILTDHEVSSSHFQIQIVDNSYYVFDMNSTNGTFVNNKKVIRSELAPGDIIRAGSTLLRFTLEQESKVRHISTMLKPSILSREISDHRSLVDTLIEDELKDIKKFGIKIFVVYKEGNREELKIPQSQLYIGRASSFGKFDQDTEISRKHLKIKINNLGEVFIEDQGSTNGSFINGNRIKGIHPVKPTDDIKVGFCKLRLSSYLQ